MGLRTQTLHPILTAETHNFPTYVCRMISRYADGYAYIFLHNSIHFLLLITCFVISSLCLLSLCLLFFFFLSFSASSSFSSQRCSTFLRGRNRDRRSLERRNGHWSRSALMCRGKRALSRELNKI